MPDTNTFRVPGWRKSRTNKSTNPRDAHVFTLKKSLAHRVAACHSRNSLQVPMPRFGLGSSRASRKMMTTVELQIDRMLGFFHFPRLQVEPTQITSHPQDQFVEVVLGSRPLRFPTRPTRLASSGGNSMSSCLRFANCGRGVSLLARGVNPIVSWRFS